MSEERNLFIWGKNFPKPTQIKKKVVSAAAGQNHIVFTTKNNENFGFGSNKYGQLGLKQNIFFQDPVKIFDKYKIKSFHCGSQHTFFITQDYEVYSVGLNIKGQLGHSLFENSKTPRLIVSLSPFGVTNNKAIKQKSQKNQKPRFLQILEKFDMQFKLDQINDKNSLLGKQEYICDIACGALFTIALSNQGRVFGCGMQSINNEDLIQKSKFKLIQFGTKVSKISSGVSGSVAITKDGVAYFWGNFGKININEPKKLSMPTKGQLREDQQHQFVDAKVGDQFLIVLNSKGQIFTLGQNIDNQLGIESHKISFQEQLIEIIEAPFSQRIYVGRNHVFAIQVDTDELYGWGSNKYGQVFPVQNLKTTIAVTNSKYTIEQNQTIIPSSYFTLFLTKKNSININKFLQKEAKIQIKQQTVPLSQHRKLLQDYQILRAMNLTLLQKHQVGKKQSREVQTLAKFQVHGTSIGRIFETNTIVPWKEIQLETKIGEGGYGLIYRAKWRQIQIVVKKFKIENGDVSLKDFQSQCNAMQAVRHPNIVMFLGAVTQKPHYSILLEYCSKGSLWNYIQDKQNLFSWDERKKFALQIAQSVHYLHSCKPPILHRDLKTLNIFLDANLRIKIGDFGWTKPLGNYMTGKIGTYQWMAPEVISDKPYTEKADVFSYSIILWEIAAREPPYRNIIGSKVATEVLKGFRPPIPPKCPQPYEKLMKKCWEADPNNRPTFKQIIGQLEMMSIV